MLTRKKFGLSKVSYEVEGLLLNSKALENKLYLAYLSLEEENKRKFRKEVESIVKKYVLGKEFFKAIAEEIIVKREERIEYDLENKVYKYLKKSLYKGNSRDLLIDLQSVLEGE